jgi:hypothetical protein
VISIDIEDLIPFVVAASVLVTGLMVLKKPRSKVWAALFAVSVLATLALLPYMIWLPALIYIMYHFLSNTIILNISDAIMMTVVLPLICLALLALLLLRQLVAKRLDLDRTIETSTNQRQKMREKQMRQDEVP